MDRLERFALGSALKYIFNKKLATPGALIGFTLSRLIARGLCRPRKIGARPFSRDKIMKVRASVKRRTSDCQVVRRKGRVYIINKKNPAP